MQEHEIGNQEISQENQEISQENQEISQEDAWDVVASFFQEKGLIQQQIDSYNDFLANTIQEIIDDTPPIILTHPSHVNQAGTILVPGPDMDLRTLIRFGQIYLSRPCHFEKSDNQNEELYPNTARLRDLTYSSPLYVDMHRSKHEASDLEKPIEPPIVEEKVFLGILFVPSLSLTLK